MSNQLPSPFATLEPFVDWALDTQTRRLYRRLEQPMEQLQTFYDAMLPLMPEILVYLDEFPCGELPEDAQRLFEMTLSLAQIAPAIEMFFQPAVVCGFDAKQFLPTHEPTSTRPTMSTAPQSFV